jgi:Tol biopolymer transport system component
MFANGTFRPGFANPDAVTRDIDASSPAWSPYGRLVAFLGSNAQIFAVPWDKFGFGITQLTTDGPNAGPAWSPDSQWIVFESWRNAAQHDIYRMTFTGGQVTPLTNDAALDYQPVWRP